MQAKKPKLAAFDQGETPQIVIINQSSIPFEQWNCGPSFETFAAILQKFADIFAQYWHTPCQITTGSDFVPGAWACVFTDNADVAGALAYHDTTPDGYPLCHIFVETTMQAGDDVGVSASHEIAEALADPCINLTCEAPSGYTIAYESCDAVEREKFPIDGVNVTDFVLPAWFENFPRAQYDYLSKCSQPFQLLSGGYIPIKIANGKWSQVFGSLDAQKAWVPEHHPRFGKRQRRSRHIATR